ncbi:MAG TPA: hypothetical protein VFM11_11375 [Burkholderiales bacterium]|nr:hypothetical protein [Burkholderiales bacterium]
MTRFPAATVTAISALLLAAATLAGNHPAGAASGQAAGGNTHIGPQSADPLRSPQLPPSYFTPGSSTFHSPAPKPPPTSGPPQIFLVYPPSFYDEPPTDYRYYCPDSRRYFPDVTECSSGWLKVVPDNSDPY